MTFHDRLYPPKGLRVLVTAGASGIGASIASAFAETGAEIHICDIDDAALAAFQQCFPSCQATHADVADEAEVAALFETQHARFGGLDVLINCAGIAGPTSGVEKITEQEWNRSIDVKPERPIPLFASCCPHASGFAGRPHRLHFVHRWSYGHSVAHALRGDKMGHRGYRAGAGHRTRPRRHQDKRSAAWHCRRAKNGWRHRCSRQVGGYG